MNLLFAFKVLSTRAHMRDEIKELFMFGIICVQPVDLVQLCQVRGPMDSMRAVIIELSNPCLSVYIQYEREK